jgi:KipI family sensor histidine kinase inhibitor
MPDLTTDNAHGRHDTKFLPCGDTALCVEFGTTIDRDVSALVLAFARRIESASLKGVIELVPTFRSLMVHYDPTLMKQSDLQAGLKPLLASLQAAAGSGRTWRIPACYDGSVAPDLAEVAKRTGLAPKAVVERHSAVTYHVYMVGFLPGYPYMGDLPRELELPRRENPRTKVPAGSIAIATTLTAVYTLESPGGWHLIGRTPAPLWDLRGDPPALLAAGDKVVFEPVSLHEYEKLMAQADAGQLRLNHEERSGDTEARA